MTHIAIITTSFPDTRPGSEAAGSFVHDLAVKLAEDVDLTIITPGNEDSHEKRGRLTISRFHVPHLPLSTLKAYNPLHWLNIFKILRSGTVTTSRIVANSNIDHILALWSLPSGYWAYSSSKRYGVPYSTWSLGSDIWSLRHIPIVRNILRRVLIRSHTRFADGLVLKDDVETISGQNCMFLPSTRSLNIIRSTDLRSEGPYTLSFLGRWHKNKGIDLLLEALSILSDTDWRNISELNICGGGPLEPLVKERSSLLIKHGRPVNVQGYLSKPEAEKLLGKTDYLVIPSRIESIPVIFSDALQANCAMIAMPTGDLPRLFTQYKVGILAKSISSAALHDAISYAVNSSATSHVPGIASALAVFDMENVASKIISLSTKKT